MSGIPLMFISDYNEYGNTAFVYSVPPPCNGINIIPERSWKPQLLYVVAY
jgi:hypothetical protein